MASDTKMTATDARTFSGYSVGNAAAVLAGLAARGCACAPYEDVFTFARWRAQGRTVRKGEHGIRLTVYIAASHSYDAARRNMPVDDRTGVEVGAATPDGARSYPRVSFVFCRCQTDTLA